MDESENYVEDGITDISQESYETTETTNEIGNNSQINFGSLQEYLDDDDITEISYNNNGQLWIKSISKGYYKVEEQNVDNALIEDIANQCSGLTGKKFNMATPFVDLNTSSVSMNFVHESISKNGIAAVFKKTSSGLSGNKFVRPSIDNFLRNCVKGHCNIVVCGENDSGKTDLVKYLVSLIPNSEKIATIEDDYELNLDKIFTNKNIVTMKPNNIVTYSDVLSSCIKQNPKWIVFSELNNSNIVTLARNSVASGHHVLSSIYSDSASGIPFCMYGLVSSDVNANQFVSTVYRGIHLGILVRRVYDKSSNKYVSEIAEVCEFYVDNSNNPQVNNLYVKNVQGAESYSEPSKYIKSYLENQGIDVNNLFGNGISSIKDPKAMSLQYSSSSDNKSTINMANIPSGNVANNDSNTFVDNSRETVYADNPIPKAPNVAAVVSNTNQTEGGEVIAAQQSGPINPLSISVVPATSNNQQLVSSTPVITQPMSVQGMNQVAMQQQVPNQGGMNPAMTMPQQVPTNVNMIAQQANASVVPNMPNLITDNNVVTQNNMGGQPIIPNMPSMPGGAMDTKQLMGNSSNLLPAGANTIAGMTPTAMSPEAQLMGLTAFQPRKQEKPQLMTRSSTQSKKKPFAKQKFFSGVVE